MTTPIAKFHVVRGVPKTEVASSATISLDGTSIQDPGDTDITVYKHFLPILSTHRPDILMGTDNPVGQVVGDGVKLDSVRRLAHVTLCIKTLEGIKADPEYTVPAFATAGAGNRFIWASNVDAYLSDKGLICAKLTGDQTDTKYFPAFKDHTVSSATGLYSSFQNVLVLTTALLAVLVSMVL